MRTFVDAGGRTWTVALNYDTLKRCKSLCAVDLMQIIADEGKLLERLSSDPILLCDAIFALCKEEADAKSVSDTDFGKAMDGSAIASATQALLEELADFFQKRTKRDILGKILEKMRKCEDMAGRAAMTKLEDPALDARIEKTIAEAFRDGPSPDSAPASSG